MASGKAARGGSETAVTDLGGPWEMTAVWAGTSRSSAGSGEGEAGEEDRLEAGSSSSNRIRSGSGPWRLDPVRFRLRGRICDVGNDEECRRRGWFSSGTSGWRWPDLVRIWSVGTRSGPDLSQRGRTWSGPSKVTGSELGTARELEGGISRSGDRGSVMNAGWRVEAERDGGGGRSGERWRARGRWWSRSTAGNVGVALDLVDPVVGAGFVAWGWGDAAGLVAE